MKTVKKENVKETKSADYSFLPMDREDTAYAKMILELKDKHKRLYETEIAGEKVIWRPLKRSEYKIAWNLQFPENATESDIIFDRETYIASTVILYPDDIVENIACVAEIITDLCMSKSGFTERKDGAPTKEL